MPYLVMNTAMGGRSEACEIIIVKNSAHRLSFIVLELPAFLTSKDRD
jgi:hypothetical protein